VVTGCPRSRGVPSSWARRWRKAVRAGRRLDNPEVDLLTVPVAFLLDGPS
jgi:hypothetical protein